MSIQRTTLRRGVALTMITFALAGSVSADARGSKSLNAYLWLDSPHSSLGQPANWVTDQATFHLATHGRLPQGQIDVHIRRAGSNEWTPVKNDIRPYRSFSFTTANRLAEGEGSGTFLVRALVRGTKIATPAFRLIIDHAPPVISFPDQRLSHWSSNPDPPSVGADATERTPQIVVAGDHAKVCADVTDEGSGVGLVSVTLFDEVTEKVVATGDRCLTYNMDENPGSYRLVAKANDRALNSSTASTQVIGIPFYQPAFDATNMWWETYESTPVPDASSDATNEVDESTGYRELVNGKWAEIGQGVTDTIGEVPAP